MLTKCSFTFIFLFLAFGQTSHAQTSDLSFSQNARTFETQHETLLVKSLAFTCLTLYEVPDGIPCNPAMTPYNKKAGLKATGLLSNGYSSLSETRNLLTGSVDQNTVNNLFSSQQVLQVEAQVDVGFVSKYLNSRYSPFSYRYFSVVRNDADPDVDLSAVQESDLVVQTGYKFDRLSVGLEFKRVDWKFIHQRFKLLSLLTPQGVAAVQPETETGYFFTPAINYNLPLPWLSSPIHLDRAIPHIGTA